ncbi:MAG: ATP-binding protein [Bacteroidota bacterium]
MANKINKKIFNTITQSLPDPIFIIDEEGNYLNVFGGSDRKKYHDGKALIGKNAFEFLDRDTANEFYAKIQEALKTNETVTYTYSLALNDLSSEIDPNSPGPEGNMWFEAHISPLGKIKNKKRLVAWVTFNITERYNLNRALQEEKEALKKANQTKDKLFSIIAHDLAGPFSSFQQILEIILNNYDSFDDETRKDYLNKTFKLARSNNELLQNLLNWSRVQRNNLTIEYSTTNLYGLVQENIGYLLSNAKDKNIQVINLVHPETYLEADENILALVIRNLISNAIKFTFKDGRVEISNYQENNEEILKIKDTGKGMDKETLSEIFNTDEINSTYGTNNEKGSGLGLMLCKEFIERHNGKIWAESTPGQGSEFFISLPRYETSNE